jgi:choline dehydrogenase
MSHTTYDYVIVGAGTAGCVLAARLSEDPDVRVALLEAGADEGPEEMASPDPLASFGLWGSSVDWAYSTTAQPGTGNAVHAWPRGKVLGGSSAINGMVHHRGHPAGYDAWETQGAAGWNYAELLPFFRRSETAPGRDPQVRGTDGPMRIEHAPEPGPLAASAFAAAVAAGHKPLEDGNGRQAEGVSWRETNVVGGRRQSAADAYLRPVLDRPNLTVLTGASPTACWWTTAAAGAWSTASPARGAPWSPSVRPSSRQARSGRRISSCSPESAPRTTSGA